MTTISNDRYVIDASAAVEYLLRTPTGIAVAELVQEASLFAPEIMDAEVLSVLRRWALRGYITHERAGTAIEDLAMWPAQRLSHRHLSRLAWQRRHNLSAYDAFYVAAAEAMNLPLVTSDRRISGAPSLNISILLA